MSNHLRFDFAKMHGAGNDFVVFAGPPPATQLQRAFVSWACDRRRGVGADGALWLESEGANSPHVFRMHFFNCDGGRVNLCLNGGRCVAQRAVDLGWCEGEFQFRTELQTVRAQAQRGGSNVGWVLAAPRLVDAACELPDAAPARVATAVDTGDPHLVVELDTASFDAVDFHRAAGAIRHWGGPFDAGSNVHFICRNGDTWQIRSFERGIEAETKACGSGCLAAAFGLGGGAAYEFCTASGDRIRVQNTATGFELVGPCATSFVGTLEWTLADA